VGETVELTLPELETVRLILLAPEAVMADLTRRHALARAVQAEAVLRGLQYDLAAAARHQDILRRLGPHYRPFMTLAESSGAYGLKAADWLNPQGDENNCIEWYEAAAGAERWARWHFKGARAGRNYFIFQWHPFGRPLLVSLFSAAGEEVFRREIAGSDQNFYRVDLDLPADGDYVITMRGVEGTQTNARLAKAAFLVPADKADWLPARPVR
ncbi:MAG: hypothetical protein N2512_11005, partial [Armatimonadetes bacterium]|nr:hypothetical protein [Armatimonadota bacterium]